jgi:hypothetical protein
VKAKAVLFLMIGILFIAGSSPAHAESGPEGDKVIAYYFYGGVRCSSCMLLEKYTGDAMVKWFPDEISAGLVEWKPVDLEKSGNEHFVKDFNLYSKAVIVADTRDGRIVKWKNLDKVWTLLNDRDAFHQYVRAEVAAYLESR